MPTVLIVDDSATDRRLATGLLEKHADLTLIQATDGADAAAQLELHLPDLVVTDLMMPRVSGLELVDLIQRDFPRIPVILMTSQGSEEIAVQALRHGAASYVPKRRLADDLAETVARTLAAALEDRTHTRLMNRVNRSELSFVLENDLSLLVSLARYLRLGICEMRLCNERDQLRVGTALEEALLNAYYHGNLEVSSELREVNHRAFYDLAKQRCEQDPYRHRHIYVDVHMSRTEAVYVIRDEGPGFDPSLLPDPTDLAYLDRPSGRGLLLMRTFMDSVQYNATGNEVTMIKRRAQNTDPPADAASEAQA